MGEGELVKTFNIDRYRTVTLFDLTVLKFTRELGGVVRTHQLIDELSKIYAIKDHSTVTSSVRKLSTYGLMEIISRGVYRITPEGEWVLKVAVELLVGTNHD